jgi:hypothetical protein
MLLSLTFMASAQTKIDVTVNGNTQTATLSDNVATEAFRELLGDGAITIRMSDYGGFEKVGALPQSLPTANEQITTVAGDIMLYQGNNIVMFYGSNSWSYTRLGRFDGLSTSELKTFLGSGNVDVTISLHKEASGIANVIDDKPTDHTIYDMQGRIVKHPMAGKIYIVNGKKVVMK